jgi:hypothetical protein
MRAATCACALVLAAPETAAAQGGSLRLALESAFETVAASGAGASVGVSRLRADLSTQRTSRRSKVIVWGGLTAERPWPGTSGDSLAGALSVDGSTTLSRRNSLNFSGQVSSAPVDVFASLGSGSSAVLSRSVLNGSELTGAARTTAESGHVALTRILNAGSQVSVSGTQSIAATGHDRVASTGLSARLSRKFGAHVGWHAGYGFTRSISSLGAAALEDRRHDLDAGLDYARPLAFSRHTTMAVTSGSTVLTGADGNQFRLNVAVELRHQLTRRWSATANYSRPIEYVAGFARPLLSDAVRVAFTGTLPQRISLIASAGAARGMEANLRGAHFSSYTGAVRLARRLSRVGALEIEYYDASYRFDSAPQAAAIPPAFARRGVRAGIVWAPAGRSGLDAASK